MNQIISTNLYTGEILKALNPLSKPEVEQPIAKGDKAFHSWENKLLAQFSIDAKSSSAIKKNTPN